ncbi:winged helix-turn-helix transcriptional regulator [Ferroglobus sp.]|uniref:helix-turn-helix transcriptional regulator n=1 Tax=Ferroglobus sp. TaxID=2614230 RepID=UPI0025B9DD2A|nr:winged helix-turn-helix transcriptional regulator [Ferroglobus sp.]
MIDTREEILKLLEKKGEILQKDLWKELNIDSSKCSRILRKLEKEGLIKRIEVVVDGVKTFKIVPAHVEVEEEEEEPSLIELMKKVEAITGLPPCFGCLLVECDPKECLKLEIWCLRRSME